MYKVIIGLEVHVELNTKSKMFCSCPNNPNEQNPNMLICPICLGHPGVLPVINQEAVRKTIKTGLALNCQILKCSKFDRKNYFYPDLPKGYQISQLYQPLCREGFLVIDDPERKQVSYGASKKIKIREVHLEEDTGKLVHPVRGQQVLGEEQRKQTSNGVHPEGADYSLVDFNRAGIPLMELVTEPDITSAKEARKFAEELQMILRYLNVTEANMEKGEMRIEANISLSQISNLKSQKLGTKVEIKNLNSFRSVERALEYEIERQTNILNSGKKIVQETRGWDENRGVTISRREKEEAHDYRYFPEPDLPPLHIIQKKITEIQAEIPELPQKRRERFKKEYKLDEKSIEVFVQNKELGQYFEKTISELNQWVKEAEMKKKIDEDEFFKLAKLCSNYIITDLQGLLSHLSQRGVFSLIDLKITPENFAEFITLIYKGKISSKIAKQILGEMFNTGADPSQIIEEKGLVQITDEIEIEKIIKEVISKNPKAVSDFKKGKANAVQFLIGKIMAVTKGKANPQIVQDILKKKFIKS